MAVEREKGTRRRRLVWALGLGLLVAATWALRAGGAQRLGKSYQVASNSMAPALVMGDYVRADDRPGARHDPKRGEVWVFQAPGAPGTTFIKRVVGLPGETVAVIGGRLLIDGKPAAEPATVAAPTYAMTPRTLGPDEFFVLGDNRNASADSHAWGPVPRGRFLGRVTLRFWPPGRAGGF